MRAAHSAECTGTSDFATVANVVKPETNEQHASIQLDQSTTSNRTNEPTVSHQPSLLSRAVNALSYFATEIHSLVEPTVQASSGDMRLDSGVRVADAATQSSTLRKDPDARSLRTTDESGRKTQVSHHPRLSRIRPLLVSGETVTANIGTLTAGSSVTITYR